MAAMNTWAPGSNSADFAAPQGGYGGDINAQGADADPFAYTQGSLLTPWQGRFSSGGYGGGYSAPAYNPFQYADINYQAPNVGSFTEQYQDPAAFRFADFAGPSQFQAPTAADMYQDPAYQGRLDAASRAAKAAGATSGMLRTGSFVKGMANQAQDLASQEYGNVYNRRKGEWDTEWNRAKDMYGINQGNTKEAFDTNVKNKQDAYNTRLGAFQTNADIGLKQGELGWNVASGSWDRNFAKARQGYEDEQAHNAAVAAASNANASASYERDLGDYTRARDEFWTNQDRQNAITTQERDFGYGATQDYANQLMGGYGAMGDYAVGAGDAAASSQMARGGAWNSALSGAGDMLGAGALYGSGAMGGGSSPKRSPTGGVMTPSYSPNAGIAGRGYQTSLPSSVMNQPRPATSVSTRPYQGSGGVGGMFSNQGTPYSGLFG